jgi:hypothetical protein
VDVETNGGVAGGSGRVVEIAIVNVDRGAIGGCYSTLVDAGVADSRIETVSFGEEQPAVMGGDEGSWAQNRRAELKRK